MSSFLRGSIHHVVLGEAATADEARLGAIVEIGRAPSGPRPADRNIAEVAKDSGEYRPSEHRAIAPVDAINDDTNSVAQFVGQVLADDPADDRDRSRPSMQEDIFRAPRLTPRDEGPVYGFDDIAAFTELSHCRFKPIGKVPEAGLGLARQPKASQHLQASNAQRAIEIGAASASLRPQVEEGIVGLPYHRAIDAGKALGGDFCPKLHPQFDIRLGTKFQGHPFLGAQP